MNNWVPISQLSFWRVLTIYVFVGVFSINFLLYASYYYFAFDLPRSEIILLARISDTEAFPALGFGLSILPAVIASLVCHISNRIRGVYGRCLVNIIGISIASIVSTIFLPVSIPSALSYLLLNGNVAFITAIRHPSTSEIPRIPEQTNPELLAGVLQLAQNRLSLLVRESIWIIVTVIVAAATIMFFYLSSVAGPIMSTIPSLRIFYQLQTIFFGGFLLYITGGYLGSGSYMLYQKMVVIEKQYLKCIERGQLNEKP